MEDGRATTTTEALLRLPEAAKYLDISKDRLRSMIRVEPPVIPFFRLSARDTRFNKADLDAWLDSCRRN